MSTPKRKFARGEYVTKIKGSSWTGRIVGTYSTSLTPVGYCVESVNEPGSVQIYPEAALELASVCPACLKYGLVKQTNISAFCKLCRSTTWLPPQPEQLCLNPKT